VLLDYGGTLVNEAGYDAGAGNRALLALATHVAPGVRLDVVMERAARGVAPGDIWFVGDRLDTDIAGARAAGMRAVWLRPPDTAPSDVPDLTVRDWTELRRYFEAAGA